MPRWLKYGYGHPDQNQREIVAGLRKLGYSVAITSKVGRGFPDLCVGKDGRNWLLEVKRKPDAPKERAKPGEGRRAEMEGRPVWDSDVQLTTAEVEWHQAWGGQVAIVHSLEEAIAAVDPPKSDYLHNGVGQDVG